MNATKDIRRNPRKTGLLATSSLAAVAVWAGILTDSEDHRDSLPVVDLNAELGSILPDDRSNTNRSSGASPETDWSISMEKVEKWKEILVIPIQASTGITTSEEAEVISEASTPTNQITVPPPPQDLKLTSTLLFGKIKKAVLGGITVQVGDSISRYVVEDIRSREIDLRAGNRVWTLRMSRPGLGPALGDKQQ
ncbi:MAG TPA: hypothetical protein DDW23_04300 [Planctomycetes bacterium]|nr:hypothetical protein [Planctomycetota bacterium]